MCCYCLSQAWWACQKQSNTHTCTHTHHLFFVSKHALSLVHNEKLCHSALDHLSLPLPPPPPHTVHTGSPEKVVDHLFVTSQQQLIIKPIISSDPRISSMMSHPYTTCSIHLPTPSPLRHIARLLTSLSPLSESPTKPINILYIRPPVKPCKHSKRQQSWMSPSS